MTDLLRFDIQPLDPEGNALQQFQVPNYYIEDAIRLILKQLKSDEVYAFLIRKSTKLFDKNEKAN